VNHVNTHLTGYLARERQREMLEQAAQHRLANQAVATTRAMRRVARAERRMRKAVRNALRLRAELEL
jgi:hypothetical protein